MRKKKAVWWSYVNNNNLSRLFISCLFNIWIGSWWLLWKHRLHQYDGVWVKVPFYQQAAAAVATTVQFHGRKILLSHNDTREDWGTATEPGAVWNGPHLCTAPGWRRPAHHTHTWIVHHPHQALITQNTSKHASTKRITLTAQNEIHHQTHTVTFRALLTPRGFLQQLKMEHGEWKHDTWKLHGI